MGWVAEYCFQQNIQYTWPQTTKDAKPGSGLLSDEIMRYRKCNAAPGRGPGAPRTHDSLTPQRETAISPPPRTAIRTGSDNRSYRCPVRSLCEIGGVPGTQLHGSVATGVPSARVTDQ